MEYRTEELDDIILAACNGDGSAMIWLAKYYITKDIDPNSAKLWAHKAADSGIDGGNVVARQVFSVLAIADAELDEYELAYTEWMNVKWLAEDAQNRITFSVREREKAEFDRLDSIFGGAYAYFMSDKYKEALELLEEENINLLCAGGPASPYVTILHVLCQEESAREKERTGEISIEEHDAFLPQNLKSLDILDKNWECFNANKGRPDRSRILMIAAMTYANYLRIFENDLRRAYSVLDRAEQAIEYEVFKEHLARVKKRYKKTLFGVYKYQEE